MLTVDLNADMGESFGPWIKGSDEALLDLISSANIACGFHAGDPLHMMKTVRAALRQGVGLGVHPGFADLQGFGRRQISLSNDELRSLIAYQTGAMLGMARAEGGKVGHFKLHGALANMAAADQQMAEVAYSAALDVDPDLLIYVLPGTAQEKAARALGAGFACEIFADRAYEDDASLRDRRLPGALIEDPDLAATRIHTMLREGAIIAESGARIEVDIQTICVHGDGPSALAIARAIGDKLHADGITIAACAPKL